MDTVCKIVTLANGTEAKIRLVSPHVRRGLHLSLEENIPPKPPAPTKEKVSLDGHTEFLPAGEGDPEYEAWKREYAEWDAKAEKVKAQIGHENGLNYAAYAVVSWRRHLPLLLRFLLAAIRIEWVWRILGLGWESDVPEDWEPDRIVRVPEWIDRRGLYVNTEIISAVPDYAVIRIASTAPDMEPITRGEVKQQLDGFPPNE